MLKMSEAQAFVAPLTFLADSAYKNFGINLSRASRRGGITCWPESVQYLLRTYETSLVMRDVLDDIRTTSKKRTI